MHSVMPLLQLIKDSSSLQRVKVSSNDCHVDAALAKWILDALLENQSQSVAFILDTCEAVTHLLGKARPGLVSLELSIHYDLGEDVQAAECAIGYWEIYDINWAVYRLGCNRMTLVVRTFSTKLLIGWLATGTRMEKYGNRLTNCHCCGDVETVEHLFRCPENRDLFISNADQNKASNYG
jgi:hypothetical protein